LKELIDLCPLWAFEDKDLQRCLASYRFCDIDVASAWESCPVFEKLLKIFVEVLKNEIEVGVKNEVENEVLWRT
jgi:hypothetical protein